MTKILFPPLLGYAAGGLVLSLAVHLASPMAVGAPVNEKSNLLLVRAHTHGRHPADHN
jgi:hypothetical protein